MSNDEKPNTLEYSVDETSYKKIRHYLKKHLQRWWLPLLAYGIALLIYLLAITLRYDQLIQLFFYYINAITFLLLPIWVIKKLLNSSFGNRWYWILAQLIFIGMFAVAFYGYFMLMLYLDPLDYYGAHKTIPDDIDISEPLYHHKKGYGFNDETQAIIKGEKDNENNEAYRQLKTALTHKKFVIVDGSQGGIYYYITDYHPNEIGYFYLKVYEVNSNDRLSKSSIDYRSKIKVNELNGESSNKLNFARFTIHEGSWNDMYGARIEMWYQPTDKDNYQTQAEYKISERNYIIEGWQR